MCQTVVKLEWLGKVTYIQCIYQLKYTSILVFYCFEHYLDIVNMNVYISTANNTAYVFGGHANECSVQDQSGSLLLISKIYVG